MNGVGKTTTIGKIGKILKTNGSKVMFAASDTFRAAAIEQLENWASKVDVQIVKSSQGADPASVAFKAVDEAIKNNFDQVLIDTAGRLQNKKNLMEEYKKIANVTKKIDPNAPHNVILVLDATSGQNVLNQVEEFNKIIPITGIVMTKLDGTAKGGILLALAKKYEIPIIALGLGEKEDDLQLFEAEKFAEASANFSASNNCKSSSFSPKPSAIIGISYFFANANKIPPFAVPSNFVITIPVIGMILLNSST